MAEQVVGLKFEGSGQLIPFLQEAREQVNGLRVVHSQAQTQIQGDLKKTSEAVKETGQSFNVASKLVVALAASAQQGLPALIRNLSEVADVSEVVASSLSAADKANFTAVNAGLRDVAKNQNIVVEGIEEGKAARIDALVAAKKLTLEEANLLKQVTAVVDTFKKLDKVKLPAVSLPSPSGEPSDTAPPDALLANAQKLRDAYSAAATEAASIGEQFGKDSAPYLQALAVAEKLKKELAASVVEGGKLQQRIKATQADAEKIAKTSGINTKEFKAAAAAAAAVKKEAEATAVALGAQGDEVATVRQQYRAALTAAQELSQTPGPEYDEALREVARLKKLLDDTASSVRNLNPGDKVRAFTQLGNAIASGAQAIGGFAIAFGGNNQALQETLFKFQSALFALQGAQSFLKDFGDALADVRRILGLNTLAQVENTVASEADIVVKEGQTAATLQAGAASTTAATGIKAFTASILASPLFPFVLLIGALGAAFVFLSDETKKATDSYQKYLDLLSQRQQRGGLEQEVAQAKLANDLANERLEREKEFAAGRRASAERTTEELKRDAKRQEQITLNAIALERKFAGIRKAEFESLQAQKEKAVKTEEDAEGRKFFVAIKNQREFEKLRSELGLESEATQQEVVDAYYAKKQAQTEQRLASERTVFDLITSNAEAQSDLLDEETQKQREAAKATLAIREQLAAEIEAIEKQLADKIRDLEIGGADPLAQLELQRRVADEELALLERNLRREVALQELRVKVGTKAFQDLSEAQKKAAADAIIEDGGGQLSTKQAEAFAQARLLIERDFLRQRVALQLEFDQVLADASGDAQVRELAALDALLVEREKKLRDAGATQAEIDADAAKQVLVVQEKLAKDRLALDEQTQLDLLGAQLAAASGNEALERAIQEKILAVKIEFAIKALKLIEDNGTAENTARIAAAKKTIEELKAELGKLKEDITPFRLSDLFNLSGRDADAFNQAASELGSAILDIVRINNEAQQAQLDAQISATDQLIEDYRRRGDELQAQLEKDEQLNRDGLANNLNATLEAIEANKRAEAAALAEKKRIQAEKQKLARQQVIIDSISQASSLATSAAQTIQGLSGLPFGVGLITAFALVAQMYAFFAGFKAKLAAASQPQALKTGTKSVQLNGAPDGIDTVPAWLTRDEAVVPVAENRKHRGLVGAIIDDDFSKLTAKELEPILAQIDLTPLLSEHGITVNADAVGKVTTMNNTHRERVEKAQAVDMAGVERRLDALSAEVKGFRKQEGDKPETLTLPDGTVRVKRRGHTEYIRP